MKKIFGVLSLVFAISLSVFAVGGFKNFSVDTMRFGGSPAGLRTLSFDEKEDGNTAKITVDPANEQFSFNNQVNILDKLFVDTVLEASRPYPAMTETQRDALTPAAGEIIYNTTANQINFYDGSAWTLVGGGGLDRWAATEDYKTDDVIWLADDNKIYRALSDFTSGGSFNPSNWTELSDQFYDNLDGTLREAGYKFQEKSFNYKGYSEFNDVAVWSIGNAAEFGTGAGGTAVTKTTAALELLEGSSSWKLTGATQNDWVSISYTTPDYIQNLGARHAATVRYLTSVDGDWEERVKCDSTHKIDSNNATGLVASEGKLHIDYGVDKSEASCEVGFQCVNGAGCADLVFANLRYTDDDKQVVPFTVSQVGTYSGFIGINGSNQLQYRNELANDDTGLFRIENVDHTRYVFEKEADFVATVAVNGSSAKFTTLRLYNAGGTEILKELNYSTAGGTAPLSMTTKAQVGDYLVVTDDSAPNPYQDNITNYFSVTATAQSSGTVNSSDTQDSDWLPETKVLTGHLNAGFTGIATDLTFTDLDTSAKYMLLHNVSANIASGSLNSKQANYIIYNGSTPMIYGDNATSDVYNFKTTSGPSKIFTPETGTVTLNVTLLENTFIDKDKTYLQLVKLPKLDIENFIIENYDGSFESETKQLGSDFGGTGTASNLTFNMTVGDRYLVTGNIQHRQLSTSQYEHQGYLRDGATVVKSLFKRGGSSSGLLDITDNSVAEVFIAQTTSLTVEVDYASNVNFNGSSSHLTLTKLPTQLGLDQLGQVVTNVPTNGAETAVKGQFRGGKQLYIRSYTIAPTTVAVLLDNIGLGLTVYSMAGTWFNGATQQRSLPYSGAGGSLSMYGLYDNNTGNIYLQIDGSVSTAGATLDFEYTKP